MACVYRINTNYCISKPYNMISIYLPKIASFKLTTINYICSLPKMPFAFLSLHELYPLAPNA